MSSKLIYADGDVWTYDQPQANGTYRVRWRKPSGGYGDTERTTLESAKQRCRELAARKKRGIPDPEPTKAPATSDVTVAQAADHFLDGDSNGLDWGTSTLQNKINHFNGYVLPSFGDSLLAELGVVDINRCIATYPGTAKRQLLYSITAFIRWCPTMGYDVDTSILEDDRLVDPKGSRRKVDPADIPTLQALEDAAASIGKVPSRAAPKGREWRGLALKLAAYAGHRPAELMAVTPARVKWEHGEILVDAQWHKHDRALTEPKYGSTRYTMLPPQVEDALRARCDEVEAEHGRNAPLFPLETNPNGFQTSDQFAKSYLSPATFALPSWDSDRWTLHSLRHFFATHCISTLGIPVVDVSAMMGHSKPSVTWDMYIAHSRDAMKSARERARAFHS